MLLAILALSAGLLVLVISADRFVDGAASIARISGAPPLLIGMLVIGFGTSAPEMIVSVFAAVGGNPGVALGNAYGSNIANIALILGIAALVRPIVVQSGILKKELPILSAITLLAAFQISNGEVSRLDASILLGSFVLIMGWSLWQGLRNSPDSFADSIEQDLDQKTLLLPRALIYLTVGLLFLVVSSRLLVWGAVYIAHWFGVSDLIIGLTIVAFGTSLPELASAVAASRKGENDLAMGNIIGSNMFNTLMVVGLAGVISPMSPGPQVFQREMPVMGFLTLSLFVIGFGRKKPGRINRLEGVFLLFCYIAYMGWLAVGLIAV